MRSYVAVPLSVSPAVASVGAIHHSSSRALHPTPQIGRSTSAWCPNQLRGKLRPFCVLLCCVLSACRGPSGEALAEAVVAGCSGGVTGGGSGVTLTRAGTLYRWERPGATPAAQDSTLVRVDSALAAEVFRRLQAMRFTRIQYRDVGNMSCFVIARTDSVEHEVIWGGSDGGVPPAVRDVHERLMRAASPARQR